MKKFVVIHKGHRPSVLDMHESWAEWLDRRAASIADVGSGFGPGRRITSRRTTELSLRSNPASGYVIVHAEHIDAAEQLLEGCPIVDSLTLYEAIGRGGQPRIEQIPRTKEDSR